MSVYDAFAKEQQLRAESASWDTSRVEPAHADDIPVIDLARYFADGDAAELDRIAQTLRIACERVGFFSIVGHGVAARLIERIFSQVRQFHNLPLADKLALRMDRPDWPLGGVGYLPVNNSKLPARDNVNVNEAFLVKCDHRSGFADNQWPDAEQLPEFRAVVERYAEEMTRLGKNLLPVFARALDMPAGFFNEAFAEPMYRLRMTHYPPTGAEPDGGFGINPHVDTTFCTILYQDRPGLTIFSERRKTWIGVPALDGAFVVNTGELLRQWSNDRFLSTKHFANNNTDDSSRYSIPFFFNANAEYLMKCIPSCCDEHNPPKYQPFSYASSQAAAQGE